MATIEAVKCVDILSSETGELVMYFDADKEIADTALCRGLKATKRAWDFCKENGIEIVSEEIDKYCHHSIWTK